MSKVSLLAGCAICCVAACSSGGSGSTSDQGGDVSDSAGGANIPSFGNVIELLSANAAAVETALASSPTAPAGVPQTGSATYAGPILIGDTDGTGVDASILGGIEVTVVFDDASEISGAAGNFFDVDGDPVNGTLALSNGAFATFTNGQGFDATLAGRVNGVGSGAETADFDYDIDLSQTFVGPDATILLGSGTGTASQVGTSETHDLDVDTVNEQR